MRKMETNGHELQAALDSAVSTSVPGTSVPRHRRDGAGNVGTDIVSVERIRRIRSGERHRDGGRARDGGRFEALAFTPAEIAYCRSKQNPDIHFAGHLAAKEAVYKALRLNWVGAFAWTLMEVYHREDGSPAVRRGRRTYGGTETGTRQLDKLEAVSVSIAHTEEYAIAVAWLRG